MGEAFFVGMAHIEKLEGAFEESIDFSFADFVRREERPKIEVRKAAVGDARGEKFAEAAGLDGAKRANFFENDTAQGILKNRSIEQLADFGASAALDKHRAQEAQGVAFEERPIILHMRNHKNPDLLPVHKSFTLNEMVST